jgi:hypothetical protein
MDREIGLAISIEIQRSQSDRAVDRLLENPGADCDAVVERQPRSRDVKRNQLHRSLHLRTCWMCQRLRSSNIVGPHHYDVELYAAKIYRTGLP